MTPTAGRRCRAGAAAALVAAAAAWRPEGETRPNVVLFFPDTIAAEAMGPLYGNPIVATPNFDAWAASSATVFDVAWSSFPQCSPSRAALVTGRHVHTLGHRTMTHLVQPYEVNLWGQMRAAGYTTLHFGKNDELAAASFNATYDYWTDSTGVAQGASPYAYKEAGYYSFMAGASAINGNVTKANGDLRAVYEALALINSSSVREPFALFLPGLGAHPPYGIPKDYEGMYDPATIRARMPLRNLSDATGKPPYMGDGGIRGFRNYTTFGEDFSYKVAAQYFARVTYADWVFGELLTGLKALGLADTTAVAFASDHGDFMGNYGLVEKWSGSGDDLLLHVPLALSVPGRAGGGQRVSAPVQLFDLLPTFMELAGAGGWLVSDDNVTGYVQFGNSLLPWLPPAAGTPEAAAQAAAPTPTPAVHPYVYAEAGYYWQNESAWRGQGPGGEPRRVSCRWRGQVAAVGGGAVGVPQPRASRSLLTRVHAPVRPIMVRLLSAVEYNDPTQNGTWQVRHGPLRVWRGPRTGSYRFEGPTSELRACISPSTHPTPSPPACAPPRRAPQDPKQLYYPRGDEEHRAPSHSIRLVAMRNATHKMVYRPLAAQLGSVSELYDLAADPRQLTSVWGRPAYADVQARMLADMLDWMVLTGDVTPGVYDSRNLPPSPPRVQE
jgi:arylsulfatase A-like enzyme